MEVAFSELVGQTLVDIQASKESELATFTADTGVKYRMFHRQDCCECVEIADVCGDIADLVGTPILQAEEETREAGAEERPWGGTGTWTFYKLATIKGSVTIRWLGTSNGYYSERVNFEREE